MKDIGTQHTHEPLSAPVQRAASLPPRILVVDDDVVILKISSETLTRSGYQVSIAEDGAAGWKALQEGPYDLLITDHSMPRITGVELIKKLRHARLTLPVIMASGTLPTEELNRHPWLQLAATLLKPYTSDELLETVRNAMRLTPAVDRPMQIQPIWRNEPSASGSWLI